MKAVATALILIAGAAVVLWYGNSLNSWVLGGLIGGLAALLLSIPISLTIFSYLSRRHDERLQAESQEMSFSQVADYAAQPRIAGRGARDAYRESYIVEEYSPVEEQFWDEQEEHERMAYEARQLPGSQAYVRQTPRRLPAPQQRGTSAPEVRQQQRALPSPRVTEATPKRNTTKRVQYPGFPGYSPNSTTSSLSQYRTAALRAARQEAVQQYEEEQEMLPTNVSRRPPSVYPGLSTTGSRPARRGGASRSGRMVDATPSQNGPRRELPSGLRDISHQLPEPSEPETEDFGNRYPQTGPFTRRPHLEEQLRNPDVVTGSLKNPLVRRAPYMYEDDPIRQEYSQQLNNGPIARRSSRNLHIGEDDEE